jgi:hypothetical protein
MLMTSLILPMILSMPLLLATSCGKHNEIASNNIPEEVKQFQKERDLCDHFRGEDGYDQERRKFLREQMEIYCTGSDTKLSSLRLKYQNDKAVLNSLKNYEDRIE